MNKGTPSGAGGGGSLPDPEWMGEYKVFKYATGVTVPRDAVYLCTQVETDIETLKDGLAADGSRRDFKYKRNKFVWHYFLVRGDE